MASQEDMTTSPRRRPSLQRQKTTALAAARFNDILDNLPRTRYLRREDEAVLREEFEQLRRDVALLRRRLRVHTQTLAQAQEKAHTRADDAEQLGRDVGELRSQLHQCKQELAEAKERRTSAEQSLQAANTLARQQASTVDELQTQLEQLHLSTPKTETLFVSHRMPHSHQAAADQVSSVITSATRSVDIACVSVDALHVADAVVSAAQRGATVRILYDVNWLRSVMSNGPSAPRTAAWQRVARRWQAAGIECFGQRGQRIGGSKHNPRFASFVHNMIIVDGTTLLTGTFPLASADESAVANDSTLITLSLPGGGHSSHSIAEASDFFEELWRTRVQPLAAPTLETVKLPRVLNSVH